MPNWVYNDMEVSIPRTFNPVNSTYDPPDPNVVEELASFLRQIKEDTTYEVAHKKRVGDEDDPTAFEIYIPEKNVFAEGEDRGLFSKFVPPPDNELYSAQNPAYPEGYDPRTMPLDLCDEDLQKQVEQAKREFDENNWYSWNCENWGCKWDVHEFSMDVRNDNNGILQAVRLKFDTPWAPPGAFLIALSEKFPSLSIENNWIEEQGFGAIENYSQGTYWLDREWDIPDSHAEWKEIGREDECICGWAEEDDWFDDCRDRP